MSDPTALATALKVLHHNHQRCSDGDGLPDYCVSCYEGNGEPDDVYPCKIACVLDALASREAALTAAEVELARINKINRELCRDWNSNLQDASRWQTRAEAAEEKFRAVGELRDEFRTTFSSRRRSSLRQRVSSEGTNLYRALLSKTTGVVRAA